MPQIVRLEIDLNAPVTTARIWSGFLAFFRWWGDQIIEIAPTTWTQAFRRLRTAATRLDVRQSIWTLSGMGSEELTATLDSSHSDEDLRQSFARIFPDGLSSSAEVVLPLDAALIRRVSVPAAATTRLRSTIRLQLDRLSPFRGEDLLFDCHLAAPGSIADAETPVDVAMLPKATLQVLEMRLRQIGITPSHYRVGDTGFVVKATGIRWTPQQQRQILLLLGAAAVWCLTFWLAPAMRKDEISALRAEIATLAPDATHAEEIREALGRYSLPPAALSASQAADLDILQTLSRALPDQVHLTSLTRTGNNLTLRGWDQSHIGMSRLLGQTDLFEKTGLTVKQVGDQFTVYGVLRAQRASAGAAR